MMTMMTRSRTTNLAGVEYKYPVTVHDGVEAMGYHEHGTNLAGVKYKYLVTAVSYTHLTLPTNREV